MTVQVVLPQALVRLFPGAPRRTQVQARTVRDVMVALDARWPGMADRLVDSTPAIRRHILVFVGEDRATLDTPIPPGAEVWVSTAMSGG